MTSKALGTTGETFAEHFLQRKGYTTLAKNWRNGRHGELDLIMYLPPSPTMEEQGILVFVEVKTRKSRQFGHPVESITPTKQQQLVTLAEAYLVASSDTLLSHPYHSIRFDAVTVEVHSKQSDYPIQHFENIIG